MKQPPCAAPDVEDAPVRGERADEVDAPAREMRHNVFRNRLLVRLCNRVEVLLLAAHVSGGAPGRRQVLLDLDPGERLGRRGPWRRAHSHIRRTPSSSGVPARVPKNARDLRMIRERVLHLVASLMVDDRVVRHAHRNADDRPLAWLTLYGSSAPTLKISCRAPLVNGASRDVGDHVADVARRRGSALRLRRSAAVHLAGSG